MQIDSDEIMMAHDFELTRGVSTLNCRVCGFQKSELHQWDHTLTDCLATLSKRTSEPASNDGDEDQGAVCGARSVDSKDAEIDSLCDELFDVKITNAELQKANEILSLKVKRYEDSLWDIASERKHPGGDSQFAHEILTGFCEPAARTKS